MRKKEYYYCDMDGVLADFNNEPQALERFEKEKGFFYNLKPIKENIEFIEKNLSEYLYSFPNSNPDYINIVDDSLF